MDCDDDVSPSAVMFTGDGGVPEMNHVALTRFAHIEPDGSEAGSGNESSAAE